LIPVEDRLFRGRKESRGRIRGVVRHDSVGVAEEGDAEDDVARVEVRVGEVGVGGLDEADAEGGGGGSDGGFAS
jgi:hypothetical protein